MNAKIAKICNRTGLLIECGKWGLWIGLFFISIDHATVNGFHLEIG